MVPILSGKRLRDTFPVFLFQLADAIHWVLIWSLPTLNYSVDYVKMRYLFEFKTGWSSQEIAFQLAYSLSNLFWYIIISNNCRNDLETRMVRRTGRSDLQPWLYESHMP